MIFVKLFGKKQANRMLALEMYDKSAVIFGYL